MKTKIALLIASLALIGCVGERTSIQTGEVGKQLTSSGLEEEIRLPGSFRMDYCGMLAACPKLVRLQVNKSTADLTINSLFLPESNVDIKNVIVGLQFRVKEDPASINQVFQEVRPEIAPDESGRVLLITDEMVYETFLRRKAPDAIIAALREKDIDEVLTKVPEIAEEVKKNINVMLKDAPIEVTELGFPNGIGEVPEEVLLAKRRLFAVNEEQARRIRSLEADLAVEEKRQSVQLVRVKNDVINAVTVGTTYESYVTLKTLERFADAAESGTPVALGGQFIPTTSKKKTTKTPTVNVEDDE